MNDKTMAFPILRRAFLVEREAWSVFLQVCLWSLLLLPRVGRAELSGDFWKVATPQELPFAEEWVAQKEEKGLIWKEFYFTSEVVEGQAYRIYAIYAAPKDANKAPAILYIHGGGGTADPAMVKEWAESGYPCLSFDYSSDPKDQKFGRQQFSRFGNLTNLDSQLSCFGPPVEKSLIHRAGVAARRAISWLQQRPEVDAARIGVEGISWGGFQSLLLGGMDERVKAVVDIYGAGFYQEFGANGGCFGVTGPLQFQKVDEQKNWLDHFDPQHYVPQTKAPTLMLTGTNDIFFWLPLVMRTYQALPVEKRIWLEANVNHGLPLPALHQTAKAWFDLYLRKQGTALPQVDPVEISGSTVTFKTGANSQAVKSARVDFIWLKEKTDQVPISAYAQKDSLWKSVAAEKSSQEGVWQATLPAADADAKSVTLFATVETADGLKVSSSTKTIEAASSPVKIADAKAPDPAAPEGEDNNLFQDPSFENGPVKAGKSGQLYMNFIGKPEWNDSGTKAHTGKAAVGLAGDKNMLHVGAPAEAGKTYRFSGWFRGESDGVRARMQINWSRAGSDPSKSLIKFELKSPVLTTDYQSFEIVARAPEDTASAVLILGGGSGPDETIWLDDVFYGEVKEGK